VKLMHITESIKGGIASFLDDTVPAQLAAFGPEQVRAVVARHTRAELPNIPDTVLLPVDCEHRTPQNLARYIWQVVRIVRRERPTIIHAHSSFAGLAARLAALTVRPRPTVVYCPHGWSFLMEVTAWKRWCYLAIERALAPFTAVFHNVSDHERRNSVARGFRPERSIVIYNAVDLPAQRQPIELPTPRINLLFSGRFDRQKGFDILLDAMRLLPASDFHLYAAGVGVRTETTPQHQDNVTFLGWVPREQLEDWYSSVDAVVVPSRWDACPYVPIEAMSHGTAVIASDRGALPELVIDGETGRIFPGGSAEALVETLLELDREQLRAWGKAGLRRHAEHLTLDRLNGDLINLYNSLGAETMQPPRDDNPPRSIRTSRAPTAGSGVTR